MTVRQLSKIVRSVGVAFAVFVCSPALSGDPSLPDHSLTPGDVLPATAADVCQPGYAKSIRHVSGRVKETVYHEYGLARHDGYEIDHLIAIQLGGSNDLRNLWPQTFAHAFRKDALETELHILVCAKRLPLAEAQEVLARDWIGAYRKYMQSQ